MQSKYTFIWQVFRQLEYEMMWWKWIATRAIVEQEEEVGRIRIDEVGGWPMVH